MSLRDDIIAVRNNPLLTREEKRDAIYDLKGNAIVAEFTPLVGQTYTQGIYTLTLTRAPVYEIIPKRRLLFWVRATKNNIPIQVSHPIVMTNSPIMIPDGVGGFVADLRAAVRRAIIRAIG
jgi:hypothetical protein